jgi:hypothetical protein
MRHLKTACLVALVALGLLSVPARADMMISGTFDGTGVLTPTGTPGVFLQKFTGDGTDTIFGAFDIHTHSTVDFSSPPSIVISDGTIELIFPNGSLFGTSSGTGMASGHGTATFEADVVITRGTGFFAGSTGDITITGKITSTSPTTESVTASYSGSLDIPEPGSLSLLALGAGTSMGVLVRGRGRKEKLARIAL